MLILITISLSLAIAALLGAGIFPFTIAVIAAICSSVCLITTENQRKPRTLPLLAGMLILMLTATFIPLPSGLAANFGSKRAHQNLLAEKAVIKAGELSIVKPSSPYFSITRNRAGTARTILLLIAGFTIAALSSRLPLNRKEQYLRFLLLFATSVAIAGIISQWVIPQGKSIWWLFPVPHGKPVGCFINRNHFGGFTALLSAPAIFLAAESLQKKRYPAALLWELCFITLGAASILSLSKGAWLALTASVMFSTLALLFRRQWLPAISFSASLAIAISALFFFQNDQLKERAHSLSKILQNQSAELRLGTWRDSFTILRDYPFSGAGANAFRMVFPQYRTSAIRKHFEHTENEYIQIPVEFGIPATILIAAMIVCLAARWRKNPSTAENTTISLCVAGALVVVGVHALTDFALRIPLYFLTVCSLLGLVISAPPAPGQSPAARQFSLWQSGAPCHSKSARRALMRTAATRTGPNRLSPLGALIIIAILSAPGSRIYRLDSSEYLETAGNEDICQALVWSPTSWQAWYNLGRIAVTYKTGAACLFGENCLTQATRYDPLNYQVWEELARLRFSMQDLDGGMKAYNRLKELRPWKQINEFELQQPLNPNKVKTE